MMSWGCDKAPAQRATRRRVPATRRNHPRPAPPRLLVELATGRGRHRPPKARPPASRPRPRPIDRALPSPSRPAPRLSRPSTLWSRGVVDGLCSNALDGGGADQPSRVGGVPSPDSREVQRVVPWPFEDGRFPSHLGAVVMRTVLSGERAALQVVHFPEGDWGVADGVGDPNEPEVCAISHIRHVVDGDASLEELASLAPGMAAERSAAGEPW